MKQSFKIGDKVRLSEHALDNDSYTEYKDMVLTVRHVAHNTTEDKFFDSVINEALYDLRTPIGNVVNFSLYDYELVKA